MAIKESTHFYDRAGLPVYQVPYADPSKGLRNTTLKDCKKMSLCPSVTAILSIPSKPGLDRWKQNQILDAAFSCKVENEKDWKTSVLEIANEIPKTAREKGAAIHAAVEKFYLDWPLDTYPEEYENHVLNTDKILKKYYPASDGWVAEKPFAHPLGYGGKVDLHGDDIVIDFKTKDFDEDADPKKLAYPEMAMQLDAYRHGLKMPKALMVNIFIDRESGRVKLYEWPEDKKWFDMFCHLLEYWKLSRGFDSSFEAKK